MRKIFLMVIDHWIPEKRPAKLSILRVDVANPVNGGTVFPSGNNRRQVRRVLEPAVCRMFGWQ